PNRDNYLADFGYAFLSLREWNLFAQYCNKWIWYDNEDDENLPLADEDILLKERIDNPLFAKYAPKS
ncbi:MAG: hypothetical protein ACI4MY_06920, partial [Christensenellales bacterium]